MKNLKLKVLALSLTVLLSSSPSFASPDATATDTPAVVSGDVTAAPAEVKNKKGFDWRFISMVPGPFWLVGVPLWLSGWEPADLPPESPPGAGGTPQQTAQESSWGNDPWGAQ